MKRRIITAAFLFVLACSVSVQSQEVIPSNGLLSPEESLAYIQGLSNRNFFDECLVQAREFSLRYPKHPYAENVEAYKIQALYALQRYEETADAIREFLTLYPKSEYAKEFHWTQAESYFNARKFPQAFTVYEEILKHKKHAHQEDATYRIAICLIEMDRKDDAVAYLQKLADLKPDADHLPRIYARQYLAIMKQNDGEFAEALAIYQPLLEVKELPDALRKNLLLSAAYLAFKPSIQNYQQAAELYSTVLAEFPDDPSAAAIRKNLLSCHFALQNYKNYLELYGKYSKSSKMLAGDRELKWLAAQANVALERYGDAMPLLMELANDPSSGNALQQNALHAAIIALDALRDDDTLVTLAKRYRENYPTALDSEDILLRAANAEMRSGKYPEAIADFRELLPMLAAGNPVKYQNAGCILATLLDKTGDYTASAQLFLDLAAKAPETTDQKDYITKRELQKSALTPLFRLKNDPRGLELVSLLCDSSTDEEELTALLKFKYQFAINAAKYDNAINTIGMILEKVTPAQQPEWLAARAKLTRGLKRYSQTADDYLKVFAHSNTPKALRAEIITDLVTLLYYTRRQKEAAPLLQELFSMNPHPEISEALLYAIAKDRINASDFQNVRNAYERILSSDALTSEKRDFYTFMLADTEFRDGNSSRAKELLNTLQTNRTRDGLPPGSDTMALLAEIAIQEKHPDVAIVYAKQALEGNDRTISKDTLPRARWALAQAYLEAGDNKSAFTIASQGFILTMHPLYAPRCYLVASQAKARLGDKRTAQELLNNLKEEYPDFQ